MFQKLLLDHGAAKPSAGQLFLDGPHRGLAAIVDLHHDLVDHTHKYKAASHSFFLDLKRWRSFKTRYALKWQTVPFVSASRKLIPQERGIYVFTARLMDTKLPDHGYMLYVGITGDDSSKSNLQVRYGQYVQQMRRETGRPAISYMLTNWRGDLQFNYVPLPNPSIDLAKLEKSFINSIMPPMNRRDFTPKQAAVRQSAF